MREPRTTADAMAAVKPGVNRGLTIAIVVGVLVVERVKAQLHSDLLPYFDGR